MATIREAVSNIERHAHATEATIALSANDGHCQLRVADNGQGFDGNRRDGGLGLTNMRRRAEKLNGEFDLIRAPTGGTVLIWRVPFSQ
jgi:signal transduction histidine kinase